MKKPCLILLICTLSIAACSKHTHNDDGYAAPDDGCIEQHVVKQSDPILPAAKIKTADSLFDLNHIDHSHYRYTLLDGETIGMHLDQVVKVEQYINGLRVFVSNIHYIFWDGSLHDMVSSPVKGPVFDVRPTQSLSHLRALFTRDLKNHGENVSPASLTDSCYKAEFGFFNMARYDAPQMLVAAWRVSIKHTEREALNDYYGEYYSDYPCAYYRDIDGKLLDFSGNLILN